MAAFFEAARRRIIPQAIFFLLIWPLLSVGLGGAILMEQEVVAESAMPLRYVYFGLAAGALRMLPEFIVIGSLLAMISTTLFSISSLLTPSVPRARAVVHGAEAGVFFLAVTAGIAAEYPAVLAYPLLRPMRPLSVATAEASFISLVIVMAIVVGHHEGSWRRGASAAVLAVVAMFGGFLLARAPLYEAKKIATPLTTVLFGIDSLSQADDVALLRDLTIRHRGTWYVRPVTPGFTTNSVWAAILMHRNVPDTGVFFIRQSPNWPTAPFSLVARAKSEGHMTASFFSDQFTAFEGSEGGFDIDRSGPKGWLQVATAATKDASILLPLILPRIPRLPLAGTPSNQSGTYAFDVRHEINSILTAGRLARSGAKTFVAAHLDYLHQSRFPAYSEVSAEERRIIRASAVSATRDLSFNYQYPKIERDALGLYQWKIRNLQKMIGEEIARAEFLDGALGNRLILFADHGNRNGLSSKTYGDPKYHRVVLATFGIAPRDPEAPISLASIADLLGFEDPSHPRIEPTTTLAPVEWQDWEALGKSARLTWNGEYSFDSKLLARIGGRITSCRPWSPAPPYELRPCNGSDSDVVPKIEVVVP